MFAWIVRTGTTAVAFSSMVAGSEAGPPFESKARFFSGSNGSRTAPGEDPPRITVYGGSGGSERVGGAGVLAAPITAAPAAAPAAAASAVTSA